MASEYPDEDWIQEVSTPDDFNPQIWHEMYFRAFDALRFDRFYGALGGEGPISYLALSQFARDHGIAGIELGMFQTFMAAIDGEWLKVQAEAGKQRADKEAT